MSKNLKNSSIAIGIAALIASNSEEATAQTTKPNANATKPNANYGNEKANYEMLVQNLRTQKILASNGELLSFAVNLDSKIDPQSTAANIEKYLKLHAKGEGFAAGVRLVMKLVDGVYEGLIISMKPQNSLANLKSYLAETEGWQMSDISSKTNKNIQKYLVLHRQAGSKLQMKLKDPTHSTTGINSDAAMKNLKIYILNQ